MACANGDSRPPAEADQCFLLTLEYNACTLVQNKGEEKGKELKVLSTHSRGWLLILPA